MPTLRELHQERSDEVNRAVADSRKPRLSYEDRKRLRRQARRAIKGEPHVEVQTYRVWATYECGHEHSFSLSRKAYRDGAWKKRRRECYDCAEALEAKAMEEKK